MRYGEKNNSTKTSKYYNLIFELIFFIFVIFVGLDSYFSKNVIMIIMDTILAGISVYLICKEVIFLKHGKDRQ